MVQRAWAGASFDPIAAGGLWDENGTSLVDEAAEILELGRVCWSPKGFDSWKMVVLLWKMVILLWKIVILLWKIGAFTLENGGFTLENGGLTHGKW